MLTMPRDNDNDKRSIHGERQERGPPNACLLQPQFLRIRFRCRSAASGRPSRVPRLDGANCSRPVAPICCCRHYQSRLSLICAAKGGASRPRVRRRFWTASTTSAGSRVETEEELLAWLRGILLHSCSMFDRRYSPGGQRQIARETSLENWRRRVQRSSARLPASAPSPSWHAVAGRRRCVGRSHRSLPDDCRRIIVLIHLEDLSFAAGCRRR